MPDRNVRRAISTMAALAALLVVAGCQFGRAARVDVGVPALQSAVEGVAAQVQYGIDLDLGSATQGQLDGLVFAVREGTLEDLSVAAGDWPSLRATAELGLEERELGPTTQGIFVTRLEQFERLLFKVAFPGGDT